MYLFFALKIAFRKYCLAPCHYLSLFHLIKCLGDLSKTVYEGLCSFFFIFIFWLHLMLCGERNGTLLQYSCLANPMDGGAW